MQNKKQEPTLEEVTETKRETLGIINKKLNTKEVLENPEEFERLQNRRKEITDEITKDEESYKA